MITFLFIWWWAKWMSLSTEYWQRPYKWGQSRMCAFEDEEVLGDIVAALSSLHFIKMISIDALWASMI